MDSFVLLIVIALVVSGINAQQQRQRIALLGRALKPYQVEQLMASLIEGYLRAMGEQDAERRAQVLGLQQASEVQLSEQFERLVADFRRTPAAQARVSRLPIGLPFVPRLFPAACFDMRALLAIHGEGIARAARNDLQLNARDRAFMMTAELLLMQHSCHWFCKSFSVASARVLARHQTHYAQIVESVSPQTRRAYLALVAPGRKSTP